MPAVEKQLLIGGQAVERLRKAFPRQKALEQKAEAIITEWLETALPYGLPTLQRKPASSCHA